MGYLNKRANDERHGAAPSFISLPVYAAREGVSVSQARREVLDGKVPYTRSGDRYLIPADEPDRQAAATRAAFERQQAESKK